MKRLFESLVVLLLVSLTDALLFGSKASSTTTTTTPAALFLQNKSIKQQLLSSFDFTDRLNDATTDRTRLVDSLQNPTSKPGSTASFRRIAPGEWRVVYAPHMSKMGELLNGEFAPVIYELGEEQDRKITSHARVTLPVIGSMWLSVAGTYGSQDEDRVCRVDFDQAWFKRVEDKKDDQPYASLDDVPDSVTKRLINAVGKAAFIDQFAVFPVSYLDSDLIVFDFELLGTRICARKM